MGIDSRINRIIGQLKGIKRMIDGQRDCVEVLQQVAAVKKAIDGLSKEIVVSDLCQLAPKKKREQMKRVIERVISL